MNAPHDVSKTGSLNSEAVAAGVVTKPVHVRSSNKRARDTCDIKPSKQRSSSQNDEDNQVVILTKDIHPHDVLCGRGEDVYNHVGNEYFRKVVEERRDAYLRSLLKREKRAIALSIVDHIHERAPAGRFLARTKPLTSKSKRRRRRLSKEQNHNDGNVTNKTIIDVDDPGWVEIPDERAREKAAQALRENAPAIKKKMFISDTVLSDLNVSSIFASSIEEDETTKAVMALKPDERPTPIKSADLPSSTISSVVEPVPWDVPKTTCSADAEMLRANCIVKHVRSSTVTEVTETKKQATPDLAWDVMHPTSPSIATCNNAFDLNSTTEKRRSLVVSPEIGTMIEKAILFDEENNVPSPAPTGNHLECIPNLEGLESSSADVPSIESPNLKKCWLPNDHAFSGTTLQTSCVTAGGVNNNFMGMANRGAMAVTNTRVRPRRHSSLLRASLTKQELSLLFDLASPKREHRLSFTKIKNDIWINSVEGGGEQDEGSLSSAALKAKDNIFASPPLSPLSPFPINSKGNCSKAAGAGGELSCSATLTSLLSPVNARISMHFTTS